MLYFIICKVKYGGLVIALNFAPHYRQTTDYWDIKIVAGTK